jgi:hypothetical protein
MELSEWLMPLVMLLTCVATITYTALSNRSRATKEELKALSDENDKLWKQNNELGNRVTAVEASIEHMPTTQMLAQMAQNISDIHGDNQKISGSLQALERQVGLITEHMMREKK